MNQGHDHGFSQRRRYLERLLGSDEFLEMLSDPRSGLAEALGVDPGDEFGDLEYSASGADGLPGPLVEEVPSGDVVELDPMDGSVPLGTGDQQALPPELPESGPPMNGRPFAPEGRPGPGVGSPRRHPARPDAGREGAWPRPGGAAPPGDVPASSEGCLEDRRARLRTAWRILDLGLKQGGIDLDEGLAALDLKLRMELFLIIVFRQSVPDSEGPWSPDRLEAEVRKRQNQILRTRWQQDRRYVGLRGFLNRLVGRRPVAGRDIFLKLAANFGPADFLEAMERSSVRRNR